MIEQLTFSWSGMIESLPAWKRTIFIDGAKIFAPATLADYEDRAFFRASFDGVEIIHASGHIYLRLDWIEHEYPEARPACLALRSLAAKEAVS